MQRLLSASVLAITSLFATATPAAIVTPAGFAKMDQAGGTLGKDVGFNGITTADFTWVPGETINWTFGYDGTDLVFDWGGVSVSQALSPLGNLVSIEGYVRNTNRNNPDQLPTDLSLTVDIGALGSVDPAPITANLGDNFINFDFDGFDLGSVWTVSGTAVANWTPPLSFSPNSRFAFQIAGGIEEVPAPATLGLVALGLLGFRIRGRLAAAGASS